MFLSLADRFANRKKELSRVVVPLLTAFFLTKPEGHGGFLCTDVCSWAAPHELRVASAAGYGGLLALRLCHVPLLSWRKVVHVSDQLFLNLN